MKKKYLFFVLSSLFFSFEMNAQYCATSNAGSGCISNVTFNTINNTTGCIPASPYYSLETATTNVIQGQNYTLSITTNVSAIVSVWFDWNQDFTLSSTEWYQPFISGTTGSVTVNVPIGATPGVTRMRVRSRLVNNQNGANDACLAMFSGETEDYNITIVAATPCSAKPTAGTVSANTTPCPGVITNFTLLGSSLLNNLAYQWQRANTCTASVWANLPGATSSTYSVVVPGTRAYRCIVTCLNSGLKDTTAPICITPQTWSPISNCWCIPTYTTASTTQNIENVELGALNNNTAALGNPAPHYVDYTATQLAGTLPIPIVFAGIPNTIKVKGGTGNNQFSGIWIDYNHDGLFGTSEYASTGVSAGAGGTANINFTPPSTPPNLSTVPNGVTRLRVRGGETSQNTNAQPCGATSSTTGEAEDYLVNILAPLAHDPAVTAISSPTGNCFTNCEPITVTVANYGTSTINLLVNPVKVFLKINNVVIDSQLVTGTSSLNALAGNTATVTFPCVDLYAGGTYKINTRLSMGTANGNVNGYLLTDSLFSPLTLSNYRPTAGAPFEVCESQGIGFGQGLTVSGCVIPVYDSAFINFTITSGGNIPCLPTANIYTGACEWATATLPALPQGSTILPGAIMTVTNLATVNGGWANETRFPLFWGGMPLTGLNTFTASAVGNPANAAANYTWTNTLTASLISTLYSTVGVGGPISAGYNSTWAGNSTTNGLTLNAGGNQTVARIKFYYLAVPAGFNWFDVTVGGTSLDSLSPFNPLNVPNSVVNNTNIPGTYTFYASCNTSPDCRVPVDMIVHPSPIAVQDTLSLCEDAPGSNQAVFDLSLLNASVGGGLPVNYFTDFAALNQILPPLMDTTSTVFRYAKVTANGCSSVDSVLLKVNALPNFPGGGTGLPQLFGNACAPSCLDVANLITFATVPPGSDTLYYEDAACTVLHPNPHSVCTTDTVWIVLKSPTTPACTDTAVAYIDITPALNLIANQILPGNFSSSGTVPAVTNPLADGQYQMYYQTSDCRKVASVQDLPNGISMGSTVVKQEVNSSTLAHNGQPYVNRVYEVIPSVQDSAEVCLLYLEDDINIYNQDAPGYGFTTPMSSSNFTITQTHNGNVDSPNHTFTVIPNAAIQSSYDPTTTVWTLCFKVDSFSYFYLHTQNISNAALPIHLVRFTGKRVENTSVLNWTTLSEQNNAYFEIEHSKDARNFTIVSDKIQTKANNGNSNTTLNYEFVDKLPNEGHNYYRLKQTDRDGKISMSKNVVDVYFGDETMVTMYPNPATSELNVDINIVKATNAKMKIMDATGRVVKQIDMNLKAGGNQTKVSLEGLSDGMYMVNISNDKGLHYAQTIRKN